MHFVIAARGAPKEFEEWKQFMNSQMFDWPQIPLAKDKDGKFIPDGVDENGAQKFKHLTYETDQIDLATGRLLHKKGEEVVVLKRLQAVLRPIQLFEYIIPEESYPEVLAMMDLHNVVSEPLRPEVRAPFWAIRKLMHLKPCPVVKDLVGKNKQDITQKYVPTNAVATYPVGVRADKKKDFIFKLPTGVEQGFYQEGV